MNTHAHHTHQHAPLHGNAFIVGIVLNGLFVVAEIIYGISANSLALLADAGHNASDVLGLFIAWGAMLLARRKASERYTYGLQSASILAALANALILLIAVGGIGYHALMRFSNPEIPATTTVMVVAAIGVLINGITAWMFHRGSQHDLNIRGAFLHMMMDAAISLGVVLSGLLILKTGWLWVDPLVSLIIVALIVGSSWGLLKHSTALALHAVPATIDLQKVRAFLGGLEGVKEVHDLHVWAISTSGIALSAHLIMPAGHPGDAFIHRVTHELEALFHINHATIQIEMGDINTQCHSGCDHE
jgi:cobalt-zinc-cadmium efflux system protein